jgi:hypothetical protein
MAGLSELSDPDHGSLSMPLHRVRRLLAVTGDDHSAPKKKKEAKKKVKRGPAPWKPLVAVGIKRCLRSKSASKTHILKRLWR